MDPTRSTGRHDSLLNEEKIGNLVCFDFWKIRSPRGMVLFGVATYFSFLFYEGENQVRTKKTPKDSMLGKKRSTKT